MGPLVAVGVGEAVFVGRGVALGGRTVGGRGVGVGVSIAPAGSVKVTAGVSSVTSPWPAVGDPVIGVGVLVTASPAAEPSAVGVKPRDGVICGVGGLMAVASAKASGTPVAEASGVLAAPSQAVRISSPSANACHSHHFIQRLRKLATLHSVLGTLYSKLVHHYDTRSRPRPVDAYHTQQLSQSNGLRLIASSTCRAGANMPSLDLKRFLHHGEYIEQEIGGAAELQGADVILAG